MIIHLLRDSQEDSIFYTRCRKKIINVSHCTYINYDVFIREPTCEACILLHFSDPELTQGYREIYE